MNIEIKKSIKPVNYKKSIKVLEDRVTEINEKKAGDLIWILNHREIYTAGTSFKENELLNKSIKLVKTNRGGKITFHGPGQIICYFVINLKNHNNDIRNFVKKIEKTIIDTLKEYKIKSFSDRKNIGIWVKDKNYNEKKIAAIGIKVKKWIAYHGFSLNVNNNLAKYKNIIPCGISDKGITNLKKIKDQNYNKLEDKLIINFIKNLKK